MNQITETEVKLDRIDVSNRLRDFNPIKVSELAESIELKGLMNPILIYPIGRGKYRLVAGLHRYKAFELLKKLYIPCRIVRKISRDEAELLEIDENLIREELNELQKAIQIHRKKEIYEKRNPDAKVGGRRHRDAEAFSERYGRLFGESRRTMERYAKIGKALKSYEEKLLDTEAAKSKSELLLLSSIKDRALLNDTILTLSLKGVKRVSDAKKLSEMKRVTAVNGYPSLPEEKKGEGIQPVQFNFQLLPSQKELVERALRKAMNKQKKEDPIKVKVNLGNALAKMAAFYLEKN